MRKCNALVASISVHTCTDDNTAIVSVAQGQKSAKNKSELATWRVDTGDVVVRPNRPTLGYRCPRFLNGDYRFAVKHAAIGIYDPITGGNGASIPEQNSGDVFVVSPDGRQLVFAAKYGPLHVWSLTEEADRQAVKMRNYSSHILLTGPGS